MSVPIERWTTGSGVRIRYLDSAPAEPKGLPILFVPGLSDFADEYVGMLEFFLPRRVVVVEVRGRGQSEAPPTGYSVRDHMGDVGAVIDDAGLDRFHLMTFSRGTSWGMEWAFAHPDRIASISIGDYRAWEVGMPDTFADMVWSQTFRGKPMPERIQRHVLEGLAAESVQRDLFDELKAVGVPVLVAYGNSGSLVNDEAKERFRATIPDVKLVNIPDAPHDLFRPVRNAYPQEVETFIAERGLDGP